MIERHFKSRLYGLSNETIELLHNALKEGYTEVAVQLLAKEHHADIADFITMCPIEERRKIVEILANNFDPLLLTSLEKNIRLFVIEILGSKTTAKALSKLDTDDIIYVLEDLPEEVQEELIAALPIEIRDSIKESLRYPDNSAGRLMSKKTVSVLEYWTIGQTINFLRNSKNLPEEFYQIFVLDEYHCPIGAIPVSKLLQNSSSTVVNDVMNQDIKVIEATLDEEEISYIFKQYELSSAPVVNKIGRLIGVIELDDILEIVEKEAEEDILRSAGIRDNDIHANVIYVILNRLPWLTVNLFIAALNSQVIHLFEHTIAKFVLLAAIIPIVASIGGNAGTQTLTVLVRALASKEINVNNIKPILIKEIFASICNGFGLSLIGGTLIWILYNDLRISVIFSAAILINLMVAGILGTLIPIILGRMRADPAVASSIFLTGMTDMIGFFSFLLLAKTFL